MQKHSLATFKFPSGNMTSEVLFNTFLIVSVFKYNVSIHFPIKKGRQMKWDFVTFSS